MAKEVLNSRVEAWNRAVPAGSPVLLVRDDGAVVAGHTRGRAYALGGHSAVVMVDGVSGAYAMERVFPIVKGKAGLKEEGFD